MRETEQSKRRKRITQNKISLNKKLILKTQREKRIRSQKSRNLRNETSLRKQAHHLLSPGT